MKVFKTFCDPGTGTCTGYTNVNKTAEVPVLCKKKWCDMIESRQKWIFCIELSEKASLRGLESLRMRRIQP